MFRSAWLPELFAKIFAKLPDVPIWRWAETWVFLRSKNAAEATFYRSSKTPWTRDLQDCVRHPYRTRNGRTFRVRKWVVKKCTQSGFTEAVLNIIRWLAKHRPRNCIYAINSKEEALNIRERLMDTLRSLGEELFDGDADELAKYTLRLKEMIVWFLGSFSAGAFANKMAPFVCADELDDHADLSGDADTLSLLWERAKTAEDGLLVALSKPKIKGGPIDTAFEQGDQEEWMVPCPHCQRPQVLQWERVRFGHCKDLVGAWDKGRVLDDAFYDCAANQGRAVDASDRCPPILEQHKPWMNDPANGAHWEATALGDPEVVSQHCSDLFSMHAASTWGHLALEFIAANERAKRGDLTKLQAFWNGRLGLGFEQRVEKVEASDVLACRSAYRRGVIPHAGRVLMIGFDVGLFTNTKWVVMAVEPQTIEAHIIDWGTAKDPADLWTLMNSKSYECPRAGHRQSIAFAFIDVRYRREEVYAVALKAPARIFPTLGLRDTAAVRSISFTPVPGYPRGFGVVTYVDRDAKFDLYIDRIKNQRPPRLHWPEDADQEFMDEFTNERLLKDPRTGKLYFPPKPTGPNHWGDGVKIVLTGWDWKIEGRRTRGDLAPPMPPASVAPVPPEPLDLALLTSADAGFSPAES